MEAVELRSLLVGDAKWLLSFLLLVVSVCFVCSGVLWCVRFVWLGFAFVGVTSCGPSPGPFGGLSVCLICFCVCVSEVSVVG